MLAVVQHDADPGHSLARIFTLYPLLTGQHRAHDGAMLREATWLVEAGKLMPNLDPRRFDLRSAESAYEAISTATARGKIVVDVA